MSEFPKVDPVEVIGHLCDDECPACAGEVCMTHMGRIYGELCECDTMDRHEGRNGEFYVGRREGMQRMVWQ